MKKKQTKKITKKRTNKHSCIVCGSRIQEEFIYQGFHYYRCKRCDHVVTLPYPTSKQIVNHYEKRFNRGNYELLYKFQDQYNTVYKGMISHLEKYLREHGKSLQGATILDVGCFTGEFLILLKKKGADVYGVELQKTAVKIANKKLPKRVFQVDVMKKLPVQKRFDIISLLGVVEHVIDPTLLLHRSNKLLKKNGVVLIQTPNSSSFFARQLKSVWPPYSPIEHIHLFSKKSITSALKKNGFQVESIHPHWKKLPTSYVYHMLEVFGPEIYSVVKKASFVMNHVSEKLVLPFYVGEMLVIAKKRN